MIFKSLQSQVSKRERINGTAKIEQGRHSVFMIKLLVYKQNFGQMRIQPLSKFIRNRKKRW